jgi:hypothetical protein
MMGMGGMGGGQGEDAGHMVTCPLCGGQGQVPTEVAAKVAPMMQQPEGGADPVRRLTAAMMGGGPRKGGGGHGGHGGM